MNEKTLEVMELEDWIPSTGGIGLRYSSRGYATRLNDPTLTGVTMQWQVRNPAKLRPTNNTPPRKKP